MTVKMTHSEVEDLFFLITKLEDSYRGLLSSQDYSLIVDLSRKVIPNPIWTEYFWRKGLQAKEHEERLEADLKRVA